MRIFNREKDLNLSDIEIYLTLKEAHFLRASLESHLNDLSDQHFHVEGEIENNELKKELLVAVYTSENLDSFDDRTKKLILEDR